ncbi:hypothetical protein D3C78_1383580 [compost metagenome]
MVVMAHVSPPLCQCHRLLDLSAAHFLLKSNSHFLTQERGSNLKASVEYRSLRERLDQYPVGSKWYYQMSYQDGLSSPLELLVLEAGS